MVLALPADHISKPKASSLALRSVIASRAASEASLSKEWIPTCRTGELLIRCLLIFCLVVDYYQRKVHSNHLSARRG